MSGKGSRPRPVDPQTYAREWERIFSKPQTYDLSLMHVGDWTHVPMGHPVGVFGGEKVEVVGRIVGVDAQNSSITIEVDPQS